MSQVPTPITARIGTLEIRGNITNWCSSDITVDITHPFVGLSIGAHVPLFALSHASFTGNAGMVRARQLLREIYRLGQMVHEHKDTLRFGLAAYDQGRVNVDASEAALREQRRVLRAAFKAGQLTQTAYQRAHKKLQEDLCELASARRAMQEQHLFERMSVDVSWDTYEQLVRFIQAVCGHTGEDKP